MAAGAPARSVPRLHIGMYWLLAALFGWAYIGLGACARQLDIARAGERQVNLFALTNKGISMLIRQNATQVIIKDGAGYIPRPFRSVCWVDHGTCIWTVAYTVSCMHDRSTEGGLFIPGN